MPSPTYDLKKIRTLLEEGFSNQELRDFCFFEPEFRSVYDDLPERASKSQQILKILEHTERRGLHEVVLAWAEIENPNKFRELGSYTVGAETTSLPNPPVSAGQRKVKAVDEEKQTPLKDEGQRLTKRPKQHAQQSGHSYYDQSYALVVGINDYRGEHPTLNNARNDAWAVGELLKNSYGFEVKTLYDEQANKSAITGWLQDDIPSKAKANDRIIFFFAGHGISRLGVDNNPFGYLIPSDARQGRYASYINMTEIQQACGWIPAKHIFLILDCCFSGVAAIITRAPLPSPPQHLLDDAYLRQITKDRAWQVLTAGQEDDLAADSGSQSRSGHSAFTGALLDALEEGRADYNQDGIITASDLYRYVSPEVARVTAVGHHAGQTPSFNYIAGSKLGDFVFLLPSGDNPSSPAPPTSIEDSGETRDTGQVKDTAEPTPPEPPATTLSSDEDEEARQQTLAIIKELKRRLQQRRLQKAKYGINVPPEISIEIEDLEKEIAELEASL